jgi:hypothetical protein
VIVVTLIPESTDEIGGPWAARSDLAIRKDAFDLVEVVVGGHDLLSGHGVGVDVGDVALPIPISG